MTALSRPPSSGPVGLDLPSIHNALTVAVGDGRWLGRDVPAQTNWLTVAAPGGRAPLAYACRLPIPLMEAGVLRGSEWVGLYAPAVLVVRLDPQAKVWRVWICAPGHPDCGVDFHVLCEGEKPGRPFQPVHWRPRQSGWSDVARALLEPFANMRRPPAAHSHSDVMDRDVVCPAPPGGFWGLWTCEDEAALLRGWGITTAPADHKRRGIVPPELRR